MIIITLFKPLKVCHFVKNNLVLIYQQIIIFLELGTYKTIIRVKIQSCHLI